jgi:hypothetical protein
VATILRSRLVVVVEVLDRGSARSVVATQEKAR